MSRFEDFSLQPARLPHPAREAAQSLAAAMLASASAVLARLATRLASPRKLSQLSGDPRLEFHAEASAAEGALYVDGHLVGRLPGVRRL